MVKLYLLGGENIKKRDSEHINKQAFKDAGGNPSVLIFPWSKPIITRRYWRIMSSYFKDLGARKVQFANFNAPLKNIGKKIKLADLIYLPGGNTHVFVKRLKKVSKLIKEYDKVIIGNSAGALALCKQVVLTKDEDNPKTKVISGLGLIDFSIDVHYNKGYDKELSYLSKNRKIYGIPERSALIYKNGDLRFVGKICLYYGGRKRERIS